MIFGLGWIFNFFGGGKRCRFKKGEKAYVFSVDQKVMEELLLKALMTLRKDGNLSDIDDVQYPVYPYIHDNSTAKELTAFAKKLNKKIDIKEYLAYVKKVK